MSKEKLKQTETPVGAYCIRPHFEGMAKKEKGITLIALIITIIVMLILVGVSVTVALNGGLFSTAKEATEETAIKRNEELNISDGKVEINGEWYSIDEYVSGNGEVTLPTGWSIAETKPEGWSENVTAITDGTNVIPLPKGFKLSTEETEDSIEEGLVLTDGTNEFVWVPVTNSASYTEASFGP